jgi:hypothetical protein
VNAHKKRSKFLGIFLAISLQLTLFAPISNADDTLPPPTDVSCSYSTSGIKCGNSISLSGGMTWAISTDSGSPFLEWYLSLLNPGGNPSQVSNYGSRVFQLRGSAGGVTMSAEFSYSDLVKFAQGSENSTVLVTAILFNGKGLSRPIIGRQVSISLVNVKNEMSTLQAANDAAIAEAKAQADADAKVAADLKLRKELEAKAIADAQAEARAVAALKAKSDAEAQAAADLKTKEAAAAKLAAAKAAAAKAAAATKKITITCVKGKLTKKVTGIKPKCPSGYKLKK